MVDIQLAQDEHFEEIWSIIHAILEKGDTYPFAPDTSRAEAFEIWMKYPKATYVAYHDGEMVGTYCIKPNQPGLGSHVCNAGYMVASKARGKGIGRAMCKHSLAVKLWQDLGFKIIGTLPKAFNHSKEGLVDAYVMYQWLADAP
jgi:ribosomal protein S18 acetylase RimI-like enzyme